MCVHLYTASPSSVCREACNCLLFMALSPLIDSHWQTLMALKGLAQIWREVITYSESLGGLKILIGPPVVNNSHTQIHKISNIHQH